MQNHAALKLLRTLLCGLLLAPMVAGAVVYLASATEVPSELQALAGVLRRLDSTPEQQLAAGKYLVAQIADDDSQTKLQQRAALLGRLPDRVLEQVLSSPEWQARSKVQRLTLLSCWLHPSLPLLIRLDKDFNGGDTPETARRWRAFNQDLQQERTRRAERLVAWAKAEGISPAQQDVAGWRLLDLAVGSNNLPAATLLLKDMPEASDAPPPYSRQHPGGLLPLAIMTPWEHLYLRQAIASLGNRQQLIQLLLQQHVSPNSKDAQGRTPLELLPYLPLGRVYKYGESITDPAATIKQQLFQQLVEHGARLPAPKPNGQTMLDTLAEYGEYALLPQTMAVIPETLHLADGSQRSSRLSALCIAAEGRLRKTFAALKPNTSLLSQTCPESSQTLLEVIQYRQDGFPKDVQDMLQQAAP